MMRRVQTFSKSVSLQRFKSNGAGRGEGSHGPPDCEPELNVHIRDSRSTKNTLRRSAVPEDKSLCRPTASALSSSKVRSLE